MKRYINEDVNNLTKKEAREIINKKRGMTPINKKAVKLANKVIECMKDEKCKYANCKYQVTYTNEITGEDIIADLSPEDLFVFEIAYMTHEQLMKQINKRLDPKYEYELEIYLDEVGTLLDATEALENLMMIMVLLDRAERLDELTYLENC